MRRLEYVEIRNERGEAVLMPGTLKSGEVSELTELHNGVRIYTHTSGRRVRSAMSITTLLPLLPQIPHLLFKLIAEPYFLSKRANEVRTIKGLYATHFTSGEDLIFSRHDTLEHFVTTGKLDELLVEIDAPRKTIVSMVQQIEALMFEASARTQRVETEYFRLPRKAMDFDEADEEGAGWPSNLPASVAKRKELLAENWPTSSEVAELLGSAAENQAQQAAALRQAGKLLGVRDGARGFRHPLCQFRQGEVVPEVEVLLSVLPPGNRSGWSQAFWLYSPNVFLEGARPADLLQSNPIRVIEAAKKQFEAMEHASW